MRVLRREPVSARFPAGLTRDDWLTLPPNHLRFVSHSACSISYFRLSRRAIDCSNCRPISHRLRVKFAPLVPIVYLAPSVGGVEGVTGACHFPITECSGG